MASTGTDNRIRLWSVSTGREVGQIPQAGALPLVFSPNGKFLVAVNIVAGKIAVYDVASGRELRRVEGAHANMPTVSFSRDGRTLAVAKGTAVELQEVESGRVTRRLEGHTMWAKVVAYGICGVLVTTDHEMVALQLGHTHR